MTRYLKTIIKVICKRLSYMNFNLYSKLILDIRNNVPVHADRQVINNLVFCDPLRMSDAVGLREPSVPVSIDGSLHHRRSTPPSAQTQNKLRNFSCSRHFFPLRISSEENL